MEIIRNRNDFTIKLQYKISKRKVQNVKSVSYQYIVRVPPLLISLFNFKDYSGYNPNSIMFYEYENRFYITDFRGYMKTGNSQINMKIKDNTLYNSVPMNVNKVPKNKGFQFTLPLKMFQSYLNPYKEQYIQYTLHTNKEDINYNRGLCEIEILTK